jgi:6-phosphogluconolactonase
MYKVDIYETHQAASEALARLLAERLSVGGRAVLGGGNTPILAYQLFGKQSLLWYRLQLIASDERCVPIGDAQRNDRSIAEAIGPMKFTMHPIAAELGPEAGAKASEPLLGSLLPFDVVALGLGEDAHTASLFPGLPGSTDPEALLVPVHQAPKAPPQRVSLGIKALAQTQLLVYLATGASKREAIARILAGEDLPPTYIKAPEMRLIVDRPAYPE